MPSSTASLVVYMPKAAVFLPAINEPSLRLTMLLQTRAKAMPVNKPAVILNFTFFCPTRETKPVTSGATMGRNRRQTRLESCDRGDYASWSRDEKLGCATL